MTYRGDFQFTFTNAGVGTCTMDDMSTLPFTTMTPNSNDQPVTYTVICDFVNAVPAAPYDIQVNQNSGQTTFFPPVYVVDFKVDGETVPELSGLMNMNLDYTPGSIVDGQRNFRFTNLNERNSVADTELAPSREDTFLYFSLGDFPVNMVDTFTISTLGTLPVGIDGATPVECGPRFGGTFPGEQFVCPTYGNENVGTPEYSFFITADAPNADTALSPFQIHVLNDIEEIPGGPDFGGNPGINSLYLILTFRADTSDGPIILYPTPAMLELKATWTGTAAMEQVTISFGTDPGAGCVASQAFACPDGQECVVSVFCPTFFSADYAFDSSVTGSGLITYEFSYNGVPVPELSITSAAATVDFAFAVPASADLPITQNGAMDPFIVEA